ncbi:glycine zipper domain-containing protein, partial [Actinomyces sp.]|uniref:glycine zipper domain-containing protein n=1 Tax=Actinomyces sp. TaxID=29317 RepID=UPI0026DD8163
MWVAVPASNEAGTATRQSVAAGLPTPIVRGYARLRATVVEIPASRRIAASVASGVVPAPVLASFAREDDFVAGLDGLPGEDGVTPGVVPALDVGAGSLVGSAVGSCVGAMVGSTVGSLVGSGVGSVVGSTVGSIVGSVVGSSEGATVGSTVGSVVGSIVGSVVGSS